MNMPSRDLEMLPPTISTPKASPSSRRPVYSSSTNPTSRSEGSPRDTRANRGMPPGIGDVAQVDCKRLAAQAEWSPAGSGRLPPGRRRWRAAHAFRGAFQHGDIVADPNHHVGPLSWQRGADPVNEAELSKLSIFMLSSLLHGLANGARRGLHVRAATIAEITATPAAPAAVMDAALPAFMPPMATTGMPTALASLRSPSMPMACGASGLVGVAKTGLAPM